MKLDCIPSPARNIHFSALAFLSTPQIHQFIKLKLFIPYFVMDKPTDRRSNRSRKPKIHFDEIIQSSGPSKPSNAPKSPSAAPKKPPTAKRSSKTSKVSTETPPTAKSSKKPSETPL